MKGGHWPAAAAIVLSLSLLGCVAPTPPSSFYILNSLYSDAGREFSPDPKGLSIGFGPVELPDYLDRPQIVTRDGVNEIALDEFQRWGGELKSGVVRAMAQNISYLLNTDQIHLYPWSSRTPVRYQVQFDLLRMDGVVGQEALVRARWRILGGEDGPDLASRFSTYREAVTVPGYAGLVAAESRALQRIAGEIVDSIKRLETSGD